MTKTTYISQFTGSFNDFLRSMMPLCRELALLANAAGLQSLVATGRDELARWLIEQAVAEDGRTQAEAEKLVRAWREEHLSMAEAGVAAFLWMKGWQVGRDELLAVASPLLAVQHYSTAMADCHTTDAQRKAVVAAMWEELTPHQRLRIALKPAVQTALKGAGHSVGSVHKLRDLQSKMLAAEAA